MWIAVIVATIGIRIYLAHLLPIALWSKDASSYTSSALTWVHTGAWESDPRRGPIYSLLIAGSLKGFGSLSSVMVIQHALGALGILATLGAARVWLGRQAAVPLAVCGLSYGLYDLPLNLEQWIRNETVLFFCASLTFASWLLAVHQGKARWLWGTGIGVALLTLTKNVYAPFPLLFVAGHLFCGRANLRPALRQALVFCIAFTLPFAGVKVLDTVCPQRSPKEPQDGILFYGRTAQFTVLDGGKYPEIKAAIREEIEDYRNRGELDNNIIVNRTVVPHLSRLFKEQGKLPKDLNRLCWELGLEGVNAHRLAYARQVLDDLQHLLTASIGGSAMPSRNDIMGGKQSLKELRLQDTLVDIPGMTRHLDEAATENRFALYYAFVSVSFFRWLGPVLLTSLLLPYLFWKAKDTLCPWWFGLSGVWYFNIVMLCTVGRPLTRYLIPIVPIMFWTLTAGAALLWESQRRRTGAKEPSEPVKAAEGMA